MFSLFSLLVFSFSIIVQVQCANLADPCTTDSDCGTHNNVCIQGHCTCNLGQMVYFKYGADYLVVDYACTKACQSSDECDSSNNEECSAGSCQCKYPYARTVSLKCMQPMAYEACSAPQMLYSGFCDKSWGVNCTNGWAPYTVTCLDNGYCCFDPMSGPNDAVPVK